MKAFETNPPGISKRANFEAVTLGRKPMGAIDADAHVIETVQTWSYLEADERGFTPQLMTQSFGADLLSSSRKFS